jgi:hypothetical protein
MRVSRCHRLKRGRERREAKESARNCRGGGRLCDRERRWGSRTRFPLCGWITFRRYLVSPYVLSAAMRYSTCSPVASRAAHGGVWPTVGCVQAARVCGAVRCVQAARACAGRKRARRRRAASRSAPACPRRRGARRSRRRSRRLGSRGSRRGSASRDPPPQTRGRPADKGAASPPVWVGCGRGVRAGPKLRLGVGV